MLRSLFIVIVHMGIAQNSDAAVDSDTRDPDPDDEIGPVRPGHQHDDARNDNTAIGHEIIETKRRSCTLVHILVLHFLQQPQADKIDHCGNRSHRQHHNSHWLRPLEEPPDRIEHDTACEYEEHNT